MVSKMTQILFVKAMIIDWVCDNYTVQLYSFTVPPGVERSGTTYVERQQARASHTSY